MECVVIEKEKKLLIKLGFIPKENAIGKYVKNYNIFGDYNIEVDFEKNQIFFGGKIKIGEKELQAITKPEDWVVLECVNRLLEKGYRPENISLEKIYPSGHRHSGRLDICVNNEFGSEYLLIECKTYGKEYNKAFTRLKKDGGQLFTYFKFSNKADFIMLYTSELNKNDVIFKNEIIKIEDDYRVGDVKDFYEKWNKLTKDNGIFESWVKVYRFESKSLTIKDLEEIKQEDSSFIFNRFLEILRHNVVSDKGNAFNRLFTLFLCKIYDEKINEGSDNELSFQWLEGIDDHKTFQLRLTDLYKEAMYEFLEKIVTDFSEIEFNNKYKHLEDGLKNSILREFQKIRLEKNNEFAIKDVYDEQSFFDNAIVVKEIVELLQTYKLRYSKKQQYLSDFFELLLTTGLKQESGQFFTPIPIAQFIVKSLPIDVILQSKLLAAKIDNDNLLPYVIDYTSGSGHFLTEAMHEIQRIINKTDDKKYNPNIAKKIRNWQDDHFSWAIQYIYGIEKDYRLVKVGKVGCYLHGDGLANVIHGDGLSRFTHPDYKGKLLHTDKDFQKENKQFDVVVSNPPYSVSAFKNSSRTFYTNVDFDLYDTLADSSSEIECLFVERAKQLLKDGGVAGIILPISIKSDTSNVVKQTREILFKYFEVISLCELGKNTFMATNQETTIYFLRRRNNYESMNLKIAIQSFFNTYRDVTLNGIEKPIKKYLDFVWDGITLEDYTTMLKKASNSAILNQEIFKEYRNKISIRSESEFYEKIIEQEFEKIYYFILTYSQKIVLVKSGEKDMEKNFLGYKFSDRKSKEGIKPFKKNKTIEECTLLFSENTEDNKKIAYYLRNAFLGNYDLPISKDVEKHVSYIWMKDLFTFNHATFDLSINTSESKSFVFDTKYPTDYLENILIDVSGNTTKIESTDILKDGKYPVITQEIIKEISGYSNNENVITDVPLILFGDHTGCFKYIDYPFFRGADGIVMLKPNEKVLPKYLYYFLDVIIKPNIENIGKYERHYKYLKRKRIPIPDLRLNIQQNIISEIEKLENKSKSIVVNNMLVQKENIIKKFLQ